MGGVDQRRHRPRLHRTRAFFTSFRLCSHSVAVPVFPGCSVLFVAMSPMVVAGQDQPISSGRLSPSSLSPPDSPPIVAVCFLLDSDLVEDHRKSRSPKLELDAKSEEHRSPCAHSCYNRVASSTDVSDLQRILRRCNGAGALKLWIFSLSSSNRRGRNGDSDTNVLPALQRSFINILSPLSIVSPLRQNHADLVESLCAPSLTTLFRVSPHADTDASPQPRSLKRSVPLLCLFPEALDRRRTRLRSKQIHGGGWGNILNPNGFNFILMGFVGPGLILGYLVLFLGVDLGSNGLNFNVLFQFILGRWAFSFPWIYVINETVTSLPFVHSSVRESLSLSPPLERASPPDRVLLGQRHHTRLVRFQTAFKRVSGRYLAAASIWSIFGSYITTRVLYLDPIEGSHTSMPPGALSFYFLLIIVLRGSFTHSPCGLKTPLWGIGENL